MGEDSLGNANGQGIFLFSDGAKYVGELIDDKMHGQGLYISTNSEKYVGAFSEGEFHGREIYTTVDGQRIEGRWENNEFVKEMPGEANSSEDSGKKILLPAFNNNPSLT